MPRTRRYIFNTLTVVSLLLVVAVGLGGPRGALPWDCSKTLAAPPLVRLGFLFLN